MSRVVVLTGGVGGAKLVLGFAALLPPGEVTAIVNTGDDFRHLGLHVSPDVDTLLYTLAGKADLAQGWGRAGESWSFMAALAELGGPEWFRLGDGDLALHVVRTAALAAGATPSGVTADFARHWGIATRILPMSDDAVATEIMTADGTLPFQSYFVERRCEPIATGIAFRGSVQAHPAPGVVDAIGAVDTQAIVIAPSNPYLSIDPILAVPGVRAALIAATAPVVAVSPIVDGRAVKGPTAKLMREFGVAVDDRAIAAHYSGLIDGLLVDARGPAGELPIPAAAVDTLMNDLGDKIRVARAALALAESVRR